MKKKLIVLSGPTAVGKSDLSIELAKRISGEIISADSMQVYKGMDIGSAKITKDEMKGVTHHLIDIIEPTKEFNVYSFKEYANKAIAQIYDRGNIPIIVGGTGFYIQSVIYDVDFGDEPEDGSYRKRLEKMAMEKKTDELFKMLKEVDLESSMSIHPNNVKRVIRALEYYHINGRPISEHNKEARQKESEYDLSYYVLNMNRKKLYERIDLRVDIMIEQGLVREVEELRKKGVQKTSTAMAGLGYKEIYAYLDGEYDLDTAIYLIKRNTRHFAKRQLTWFRREPDVKWIEKDEFENDDAIIEEIIRGL